MTNMMEQRAKQAAERVAEDLAGRSGLSDLDALDPEIREEILNTWKTIIWETMTGFTPGG